MVAIGIDFKLALDENLFLSGDTWSRYNGPFLLNLESFETVK